VKGTGISMKVAVSHQLKSVAVHPVITSEVEPLSLNCNYFI
jgi:hypothetical protein